MRLLIFVPLTTNKKQLYPSFARVHTAGTRYNSGSVLFSVLDLKTRIDSRAQMEIRNVELAFKILVGSISSSYLQKTVGQLVSNHR